MKRYQPPPGGPSDESAALLPRDGPPEPPKGGRGLKAGVSWEKGAEKGSVMIFFSSKNKKGDALDEGSYRCILHEHEAKEVILQKGEKGEWNLKQHMLKVHGWTVAKATDVVAPAKSSTKKPKKGSGTMNRFLVPKTREPSKDELSLLVYRYMVKKRRPFALVEDEAFVELLADVLSISGVKLAGALSLVSRITLKDWVVRDAKLVREHLKGIFKDHSHERYWSFSMDERKADNKGVPLVNVILHGVMMSEKAVQYVSIPLAIVELEEGKSHASLRGTVTKVFDSYGLRMAFCLSGTGDEADRDVISGLNRAPGLSVVYIPDPAHMTSTAVKHAAQGAGLMSSLFEPTKDVIKAVRSRYALRQKYNEVRAQEEFRVDEKQVLELVDWSATRFIGSLIGGFRFSQNVEVLMEVASVSAAARADNATKKSSLAKFPEAATPSELERMGKQWTEISRFSPVLNDMVVAFSGERYPRVSDLVCSAFMMKLHIQYFLTGAGSRESPLSPQVNTFAQELQSELDAKFLPNLDNKVICAAVACDVRFRDFDPNTIDADVCRELHLLSQQYLYLHQSCGEKIRRNATRCFYELFPDEWEKEMKTNSKLKASFNPENQERRGVEGLELYWNDTKFYAELDGFCKKERHILMDPTQPGNVCVSFKTHPLQWMHQCGAQTPRLQRLAYAVFGASSNQVGCERLWKALSLTMAKKRGKLEVTTAADQTFLKQIWDLCDVYECLAAVKPVQVGE